MENTSKTSPAKKDYIVYAKQTVFRELEATSPEEAYRIAKQGACFEIGDGKPELDPEVLDVEADEFIRVTCDEENEASSSDRTALPWHVERKGIETFITNEYGWRIAEVIHALTFVPDNPEEQNVARFIVQACNNHNALLEMAKQYSSDCDTRISLLNDEMISGEFPDIDDLEEQIGHWKATKKRVDAVIAKATKQNHETTT